MKLKWYWNKTLYLIDWKIEIEIFFYFFLDARQYDKIPITFVSLKKIRILTSLNAAQELFNAETIFRYYQIIEKYELLQISLIVS